jgi:hypothetical protein
MKFIKIEDQLTKPLRFKHYRNPALCRVLFVAHSAKKSLSSATLGKVLLSVTITFTESMTLGKDLFVECQTLDERQRSAKSRQQPSIADSRYLCRVSKVGTRQRSYFVECRPPRHSVNYVLPSAYLGHSAKYIFIFFSFSKQTFCGLFLHYVDLHVPFWHNYKSGCYNY